MAKDSEGEYARILRRLIDDPDYCRLPAAARLVWLTMLISPEFKVLGIATVDTPVLERRSGLKARACEGALEVLAAAGVVRRDGVWVWMRNHLRFQEGAEAWTRSSSTMQGLSRRLQNLPSSLKFWPEFFEVYSALGFKFDVPPRIQSYLDRVGGTPPPHVGGNPEPETPETPETPEPETPEPEPEQPDHVLVFDRWREVMGKPRAVLDEKRAKAIKARLRDGYDTEALFLAIAGCRASPFHRGANDRGKIYDDIDLIFRDAKHVEQFLEIGRETGAFAGQVDDQRLQVPAPPPADLAAARTVDRLVERLEAKVDSHAFGMWFRGWVAVGQDGDRLRVRVPNRASADWLAKNYTAVIREVAAAIDMPRLRVEFEAT